MSTDTSTPPAGRFSFYLPLVSYPDPSPTASIPYALDLAATLGGSISALIHEADIPLVTNPLSGLFLDVGALIAAAEAQSHETAAALAQTLQHQADRMALPLTVGHTRSRPELAGDVLVPQARTHDFTLLLPESSSGLGVGIAEAILFGSGGPTFLFPAGDTSVHLNCVAVAWDGSRAAARATRDAIPVLQRSGRVIILTAGADKPAGPATVSDLQRLLKDHAIGSDAVEVGTSDLEIGAALQRAAIDHGAGLIVMGAYGHSRLREFILGGATRGALRNQRLPIFMSH